MAKDSTKRWRPRISIRTLVVMVTLVCAYTACWWPTKTYGVEDVDGHRFDAGFLIWSQESLGQVPETTPKAVAPLVLSTTELVGVREVPGKLHLRFHRCYYFWFFGSVAKLPYEWETAPRGGPTFWYWE